MADLELGEIVYYQNTWQDPDTGKDELYDAPALYCGPSLVVKDEHVIYVFDHRHSSAYYLVAAEGKKGQGGTWYDPDNPSPAETPAE